VSSPRYRDQVAAGVESEPEDPSASVCKHFQAGEIGIHPQDLPAAYARIDLAITCHLYAMSCLRRYSTECSDY
jgi:hypothetical protein